MDRAKRRTASLKELEAFLENGSLPSIPQVLFKIREVTDDPKSGVADLANVILSDHQLTTRILRMANSAYYGEYAGQVTRVTQAVALMGFRAVRNAALALAIYSAVARLARCPHFDFSAFWTRSLGVGVIAKQLAMIAGYRYSEEAFIAGFLHDVGQPLLATVFPEEYDHVLEQDPQPEAFLRYEEEALGVNHMDAGSWLAKKWKLPSVLIAPIAEHHRRGKEPSQRSNDRLVDFVYIAGELYSHVMNKGAVSAGKLEKTKGEAHTLLGVQHEAIDALVEDGRATIVEIANELNMQIADPRKPSTVEPIPALNSRLALRELQLSIIQGASEALMDAADQQTVLEIIRDGAFRGLELGSLTFFEIDENGGALVGVCGYGVTHPSKVVEIKIPNDPVSEQLFADLKNGEVHHGLGFSTLARLTEREPELPQGEDETVFTQKTHDHFSALPLSVANNLAFVAIATSGASGAQLDEQRFKTLALLCNQAALALERITLRKLLEANKQSASSGSTSRSPKA